MRFDNPFRHSETETGTDRVLLSSFRTKQWLAQPGHSFSVHADTCVYKADTPAVSRRISCHHHRPTVPAVTTCVGQQVRYDLTDPDRVDSHLRARSNTLSDRDIALACFDGQVSYFFGDQGS